MHVLEACAHQSHLLSGGSEEGYSIDDLLRGGVQTLTHPGNNKSFVDGTRRSMGNLVKEDSKTGVGHRMREMV